MTYGWIKGELEKEAKEQGKDIRWGMAATSCATTPDLLGGRHHARPPGGAPPRPSPSRHHSVAHHPPTLPAPPAASTPTQWWWARRRPRSWARCARQTAWRSTRARSERARGGAPPAPTPPPRCPRPAGSADPLCPHPAASGCANQTLVCAHTRMLDKMTGADPPQPPYSGFAACYLVCLYFGSVTSEASTVLLNPFLLC